MAFKCNDPKKLDFLSRTFEGHYTLLNYFCLILKVTLHMVLIVGVALFQYS